MTVSALKEKLVSQAVNTLRDLNKQHYEDASKKKPLLQDEKNNSIFLQVMLKKIPKTRLIKMIKVNLPHRLIKDTDEVCLIAGDLNKRDRKAEIEPDILHYKTLLKRHGINHISEVLTLRQLRTEYKPYEAKQKLLAAYDVFLADNKINECLPKVLGKHFFKKRKFPIQIDLKTSNLKKQIERALSTKVFYITGQGNCCTSEVAYLDMADSEILDNVMAMYKTLSERIPGKWDNVMGVYLRTARSKAIPLYMSFDDPNSIKLLDEKEESDVEIGELSTIPNVGVEVYSDGRVKTVYIKEDLETSCVETDGNYTEKDVDQIDIIDKKVKRKRDMPGENVPDALDNSSISTRAKRKIKKEYTPTVPVKDFDQIDIRDKKIKREMREKNVPDALDNSSITTRGKGKIKKEYTPTVPVEDDFSEGIKKSAFKRKRALNESVILDSKESADNKETPVQATKKGKIQGNKKKNQRRAK